MAKLLKAKSPPAGGLTARLGFTFVELLVVITIIALLSAIGLANYQTVSKKSRDGKRKSDLEQIRAALELYRSDQGQYPAAGVAAGQLNVTTCDNTQKLTSSDGSNTYMDPIPCDPRNPTTKYTYTPAGAPPTTYQLGATMEIDTTGGTCGSSYNYCVKQP